MDILDTLRNQMDELTAASQSIMDAADAEGRQLTEAETQQVDQNAAAWDRLSVDLQLRERIAAQRETMAQGNGRQTNPRLPATTAGNGDGRQVQQANSSGGGRQPLYPQPRRQDPRNGFDSYGSFLLSVRGAALNPHGLDQRLRVGLDTTTTFANEATGAEGGFMLPPEFRNQLMERILADDNLLGRCDSINTGGNSITMPMDETEPWNDTAGVLAFWENEGGIKTQSNIKLDSRTIRLNKLTVVVPVSDELLEDAPAVEVFIRRKAPQKINFKISRAIVAGSGNGQMLGILNSPARITTPKDGAPAGTVRFGNVVDMYARMYGPYRSNAVWLINPEVEPELLKMWFSPDPSAAIPASPFPVYLPANSIANQPYATLLGRPVIPTQACNVLGAEGDIMLVDLMQYLALLKTGGMRSDVSIHVYFIQDLTAFRFVMRIGGQPWWGTPIEPRTGTFTQSAYVTLEAR